MRIIIFIFTFLFSFCCYASDHDYYVSGNDDNGKSYTGIIHSNNGEQEVNGELTDEDGNQQNYSGRWDSNGQISGETDEGISIDLQTTSSAN
jgi:hypothetical protein